MNQPETRVVQLERDQATACKSVTIAGDREAQAAQTLAMARSDKHEALAYYYKVSEELRRERAKPITHTHEPTK